MAALLHEMLAEPLVEEEEHHFRNEGRDVGFDTLSVASMASTHARYTMSMAKVYHEFGQGEYGQDIP